MNLFSANETAHISNDPIHIGRNGADAPAFSARFDFRRRDGAK
jgi:hypothetical protein